MKTQKILFAMAGLSLLAAQAQPAAGGVDPVLADSTETERVSIRVVNDNWADMRVYAIIGGSAHRLGTVTGLTTTTLTLRKAWVGPAAEVQFVAVPIGLRSTTTSQRLTVFPGDRLVYRIQNALGLSTLYRT